VITSRIPSGTIITYPYPHVKLKDPTILLREKQLQK